MKKGDIKRLARIRASEATLLYKANLAIVTKKDITYLVCRKCFYYWQAYENIEKLECEGCRQLARVRFRSKWMIVSNFKSLKNIGIDPERDL